MKGDDLLEAVWNPAGRPSRRTLATAALVMLLPVAIFVAGLVSGLFRDRSGDVAAGAIVLFAALGVAVLLTLPALAILQADVRRNEELTDRQRKWWLGSVLMFPGAAAAYWLFHRRK